MIRFAIEDEDADFYVASLALGILEAMRKGDIPASHGIWTLGRPVFWEVLEERKLVSAQVLEVIQTFDEIDAAVSLGLDVEEMIEGLAKPLRNALEKSTRTSTLVMSTEHDV